MSENGTIHISMMKNLVSHIFFLRKRGLIIYLAALKKGAIWAAHPYSLSYTACIGSNPLPPEAIPQTEISVNQRSIS